MLNMRNFYIVVLLALLASLAGCGASRPALKPFKMDIQQGNVVTSKMLLQLRPGMTKSQVRFIMGTPLVVDSFHKNRWDYFYQLRQSGKVVEQRRVILDFDKDLLAKVRGDVVPEGTAGAAKDGAILGKPTEVTPKKEEKGLLDRLKFWKKDEVKPSAPLEIKPDAQPMSKELPKAKDIAPTEAMPKADIPDLTDEGSPNTDSNNSTDATDAAADVPSVLAVPIEIPSVDAIPKAETPKIELPKVETPKALPKSVAPKAETPKVEAPKAPMQKKLPVAEPIKSEPIKLEPKSVPVEDKVLRMDKTLEEKALEEKKIDLKATETEAVKAPPAVPKPVAPKPAASKPVTPKPAAPKVEAKELPKAKPAAIEPASEAPADEGEQGYFDRMLEKIGF
jgi:outer membrane protein assembly factor BamE